MGAFRTWLEANPHGQFRAPVLTLTPRPSIHMKWIENPPLDINPALTTFRCYNCSHIWQRPKTLGKPFSCPRCGSTNFKAVDVNSIDPFSSLQPGMMPTSGLSGHMRG